MLFPRSLVVFAQALLADVDYRLWRGRCLLRKHFSDDHGVRIDAIHDPPSHILVLNSQLVASWTDHRHGPGVRQAQLFASLKTPQQRSRPDPALPRKWGRL